MTRTTPLRVILPALLVALGSALGGCQGEPAEPPVAEAPHGTLSHALMAWTTVDPLQQPRSEHAAARLADDTVLVSGGSIGLEIFLTGAERFFLPSHFASAGNMNIHRGQHTMTLLPDGKALVTGGYSLMSEDEFLLSTELYDPGTGAWSFAAPLSVQRSKHTAVRLLDGRVLVAGGLPGYKPGSMNTAEVYDPNNNTWSNVPPMSANRYDHRAVLLPSGKVLVVGGYGVRSAELYDPVKNTWSSAGSMSVVRNHCALALLPNGKVLVTGGETSNQLLSSAELYDPATNSWSPAAPMQHTRSMHTLTALSNGYVLAVGGMGTAQTQMEIYLPSANAWRIGPPLQAARYGHTATVVNSDKVLVVGGRWFGSGDLSSAELFSLSGTF